MAVKRAFLPLLAAPAAILSSQLASATNPNPCDQVLSFSQIIVEGGSQANAVNPNAQCLPFVSAVCVGGGGGEDTFNDDNNGGGGGAVAWFQNKASAPNQTYKVIAGTAGVRGVSGGNSTILFNDTLYIQATGGSRGLTETGGAGGSPLFTSSRETGVGYGGGTGGKGGRYKAVGGRLSPGGGGGAAGYTGDGGNGANGERGSGATGSGGAGGGGGTGCEGAGKGGGVTLYGRGANGVGGGFSGACKRNEYGSSGATGSAFSSKPAYGGGASGGAERAAQPANPGACRIVFSKTPWDWTNPTPDEPKSECSDSKDNDADGLIDLNDPGCSNKDDNIESDGTTQCQDGIDNDSDGATDFPADFSCSAKIDNDETNPKSQCQDGIDNDNDGAIDLADFSCQNNKQKNDEANPKSKCQDSRDNDGDGLIDLDDPGCSNSQDNKEGDGTSQCQDGVDNDSDGAIDFPADFSCSAKTDNDETNPKSQCQDGIDNDNDGAIDLADFSCQNNKQKNDEANPKTQCQDTLDNDADGLIDLNDPGCSNGQDTDESDETQQISLGTECVVDNVDGSYTAYFSYNNTTSADISIPAASTGAQLNEIAPGDKNQGQPSLFLKGMQRGMASVTYKTSSVQWTLRPAGGKKVSATASGSTPKCATVKPRTECRGYEGGKMLVQVSYQNNNPFTVKFPIGDLNLFTPGKVDRGQPREFFAGLNKGAFKVELTSQTDQATWRLNGLTTDVSNSLKVCDDSCIETATGAITGQLNQVAIDLADAANDAADLLAASPARRSSGTASAKKVSGRRASRTTAQDRRDAERARKAAQEYAKKAQELVLQIPAVIKNCPEAPNFCATVDRGETISQLRVLYAESRNTVKRVVARAYFKATGSTKDVPSDPIYKRGIKLEAKGNSELDKLPRFATECK